MIVTISFTIIFHQFGVFNNTSCVYFLQLHHRLCW
nr:MAG TPA: hypothetical protein [Caudoviricetes sp.]